MNFDIKTEQLSDDAYVISLAGEVDLYTAPEFKQQLLEVIGQGGKQVDRRLHEHDVHRLDHARRARRRGQAPAHERRPALARLQRPQHHQDLRDHRPRPRLRDLRDPRRSGREARRRLPTTRPSPAQRPRTVARPPRRVPRDGLRRRRPGHERRPEPGQAALHARSARVLPHARRREVDRGRSGRTSTTRSPRTSSRASPSRRCATSSAARSPTPTRGADAAEPRHAARTPTTSRSTSRSAPATRTAASPRRRPRRHPRRRPARRDHGRAPGREDRSSPRRAARAATR